MSDLLIGAFALMLVFEGLLPFLNPTLWREVFRRLLLLSDIQVRFIGLSAMLVGVLLLLAFWR